MTMQETRESLPALEAHSGHETAGHETHEGLRSVALGPHEHIGEMLDAACERQPGDQPRRARQLADTFMATTCRHLSAADDALLPVARRGLDDGRQVVTDYVLQSRELEHALHAMKARLYGDAQAGRLRCGELWSRLRMLLAEHEEQENVIVDRLSDELPDDRLDTLAKDLRRTELRSPTRPHPYTPHTGLVGRVTHRVWSFVDGFWDSAEGRVIPQPDLRPHPHRDSLVTRYVLGAPSSDGTAGARLAGRRRA